MFMIEFVLFDLINNGNCHVLIVYSKVFTVFIEDILIQRYRVLSGPNACMALMFGAAIDWNQERTYLYPGETREVKESSMA